MANSVAGPLSKSTENIRKVPHAAKASGMKWTLHDSRGRRKYLLPSERYEFIRLALRIGGEDGAFCATVAICGCRISEALNLTPEQIDDRTQTISFETLKRRRRGLFRSIPVPSSLLNTLNTATSFRARQQEPAAARERLWSWSRTTAWRRIKGMMLELDIPQFVAQPKALRHALAIDASRKKIVPGLTQLWLGHAKLETTMLYATPVDDEERELARLLWEGFSGEATVGDAKKRHL